MSEVNEDRVAILVRRADRVHTTTEHERARIRAAMLDRSAVADVDVRIGDRRPTRRPRGRSWASGVAAVAAAAALVVAGAIGWSQLRDDRTETPGAVPVPAPTPLDVVQLCQQHVAELDAAVGAWSDIGDWAASISGLPDLAKQARATLEAMRLLGVETADLLDELDQAIEERELPESVLGPELARHEEVVRRALVVVVFEIAQRDSSLVCPTSAIRRSLGR